MATIESKIHATAFASLLPAFPVVSRAIFRENRFSSTFAVNLDKNVEVTGGRGHSERRNTMRHRYSKPSFFRWTCNTEMAAGVMPEMRDAWPRERGWILFSFSTTSLESPGSPV